MATDFISHTITQYAMSLPDAGLATSLRVIGYEANEIAVAQKLYHMPLDSTGYIHAVVSGVLDPKIASHGLRFHGFRSDNYSSVFFQHHVFNGDVEDSMLGFSIKFNFGMIPELNNPIDPVVWQTAEVVKGDAILTLLNRRNIDEETARYYLHREGIRDEGVKTALLSLRNDIPPVGDLIRFAVRDAFNPNVIALYGYGEEYPTSLDKFIEWQGLGWNTGFVFPESTDENGNVRPAHGATWGEISWAAHWELPSPTQGFDMYHMLYPDSPYGPSPYVLTPEGKIDPRKVFTLNDLNTLLKVADYPPYWRDRLIAIADPPLTRVDVRRAFQIGIIKEDEVYHNYRAQGYNDRNAQILTQFTIEKDRPKIDADVCKLFKLGMYTEQEAMQTLEDNDVSKQEAEFLITKCKLDRRVEFVESGIKMIHKAALDGSIDLAQARGALSQLGLHGPRIEEYLARWEQEIDIEERQPTLGMLMGWYVDGIINYDEFVGRLQRLKYSDSSINHILSAATDRIAARNVKDEKQQQKEIEHAQKQQEKAQKEIEQRTKQERALAEKESKKRTAALEKAAKQRESILTTEEKAIRKQLDTQRKALAVAGTDKFLIDSWKKGLIDLSSVRMHLAARGFITEDIERWIETYLE